MGDMGKHFIISAETVARLVQIRGENRKKDENEFQGIVMRYFTDKARCGRCVRNDHKNRCKFMRENRYYPPKCLAYKEKGENL